jgi:N-acetylmuramoyl-L-alanine amidase
MKTQRSREDALIRALRNEERSDPMRAPKQRNGIEPALPCPCTWQPRTRAARLATAVGAARWSTPPASIATTICLLLAAACAPGPAPAPPPAPPPPGAEPAPLLPPIPVVDGALRLDVAYPPENAAIATADSNFIFGSTGSGQAALTINGAPVEVAPNGGFLAFVPVPPDGVYRLQATKDGQTSSLTRTVRVPAAASPAPGVRIVDGSIDPTGALALPQGETFEIGFRAPAGGQAVLLLPWGQRLQLVEQRTAGDVSADAENFRAQSAAQTDAPRGLARYSRSVVAQMPWVAADTSIARPRLASTASGWTGYVPLSTTPEAVRSAASEAWLEFVLGSDTSRTPVPLNLAVLDPSVARVGEAWPEGDAPPPRDWTIRGRAATSGPFHWFWPAGTRLAIDAERNGMLRVRLSETLTAWVPAGDVRLLPAGTPPPQGVVYGARFSPGAESVDLRIPLPERMPFAVDETETSLALEVYGATSAINFFQYGGLDPLIRRAEWEQPATDVLRFEVHLSEPVWGYETLFDASGALLLRIRRPPAIDPGRPLAGKVIGVDAGHGGADSTTVGPTRFTEARANLAVARRLQTLLEEAGARVVMIRPTEAFVPLGDRPQMARDSNVHVLVSVHNNAFPDGVNPFENNGTSVYYYHPHSNDLARMLQRELLAELGLRDIGYGRADLALARPTWLPAVLTETMFMMIPQQEAALRDPEVQDRIARAHVRALEAFFRTRAAPPRTP